MLTSTSRQLYAATSGRGRLASVSVALPPSWAGTACAATAADATHLLSKPSEDEFDFAVTGPHPVFGSEPWAAQPGQCGSVGRGVRLPFTMLTHLDEPEDRNYAGERRDSDFGLGFENF